MIEILLRYFIYLLNLFIRGKTAKNDFYSSSFSTIIILITRTLLTIRF